MRTTSANDLHKIKVLSSVLATPASNSETQRMLVLEGPDFTSQQRQRMYEKGFVYLTNSSQLENTRSASHALKDESDSSSQSEGFQLINFSDLSLLCLIYPLTELIKSFHPPTASQGNLVYSARL